MLLTQARYPASSHDTEKPNVPKFLSSIMGMKENQSTYVDKICSFPPQKFDPTWIKHVQFGKFGPQVLSRFGLGVAGYRSFGPFKLYAAKDDIPANLKDAYTFARAVATAPATWDIHPVTRNPNVLKKRGNLNKNLANLALQVFTKDDLNAMVKSKILYKLPEADPNHREYLQWTPEDDISGASTIFKT